MPGSWFAALRERFFPRKRKYNIDELCSGMERYVAAARRPETGKPGDEPKYSMREDPAAYASVGEAKPGREPRIRYQKWVEEDPVPGLLRSSLSESEAKALDLILEKRKEKTFRDLLFDLIRKRGVRDSQVYKKAQLDRRLFSKIAGDRNYRPAKDTVLALALALECSLEEAGGLLKSAGYLLSHSSRRDIMIEYLFKEKIYDLTTANIILDRMGEKIIGR